jgi:hypothetical protein
MSFSSVSGILIRDFTIWPVLHSRFSFVVAGVEVRQRLPVGVPDDVAARHGLGVPGRREAAGRFCHGLRAATVRQLLWPD